MAQTLLLKSVYLHSPTPTQHGQHRQWTQFIHTHPHQHSMANTVSKLNLSTLTHTNTAWPTHWTQFIHIHPHQHGTARTQSVNSVYPHPPTPTHLQKVWQMAKEVTDLFRKMLSQKLNKVDITTYCITMWSWKRLTVSFNIPPWFQRSLHSFRHIFQKLTIADHTHTCSTPELAKMKNVKDELQGQHLTETDPNKGRNSSLVGQSVAWPQWRQKQQSCRSVCGLTPVKAETAVLSVSLWPDPSEGRNSSLVGQSVAWPQWRQKQQSCRSVCAGHWASTTYSTCFNSLHLPALCYACMRLHNSHTQLSTSPQSQFIQFWHRAQYSSPQSQLITISSLSTIHSLDTELSIALHSHNWLPYPVYPPYIVLTQSSV